MPYMLIGTSCTCHVSDLCGLCSWAGYSENHPVIKWFWKAVEEYSNEQRLKLLQVNDVV